VRPLDNNSRFPEYRLLSNASSLSWRERPVRPKPEWSGGWAAKVAGEFGEQRTSNAPRTLCIHVGAMFTTAYTEITKTSTPTAPGFGASSAERCRGMSITLWREMLRQAQHRLVVNPSASSGPECECRLQTVGRKGGKPRARRGDPTEQATMANASEGVGNLRLLGRRQARPAYPSTSLRTGCWLSVRKTGGRPKRERFFGLACQSKSGGTRHIARRKAPA
jgi:hypothetical protein